MNVFIMILVFMFMMGYYFLDSPSQNVKNTNTDTAIEISDTHSMANCIASAHSAAMAGGAYNEECLNFFNIQSQMFCLNRAKNLINCDEIKPNETAMGYIITGSKMELSDEQISYAFEIFDKYFTSSTSLGILYDQTIVSSNGGKTLIPRKIFDDADLKDGEMMAFTEFKMIAEDEVSDTAPIQLQCPPGTIAVNRFNRWQCIQDSSKITCGGDMIYDSVNDVCIPDDSRRLICGGGMSAVLNVDGYWECVAPTPTVNCPDGISPVLNYETMEWMCGEKEEVAPMKKCETTKLQIVAGSRTVIRVSLNNCTECEKFVINEETCESKCVPDETKLNNSKCYPNANDCRGPHRAFYFGYEENRKFNCLDCGDRDVDTRNSNPPFTAVCD